MIVAGNDAHAGGPLPRSGRHDAVLGPRGRGETIHPFPFLLGDLVRHGAAVRHPRLARPYSMAEGIGSGVGGFRAMSSDF
ncbi:hypothetical protein SFOMI_5008 [Sphingobium fuliginis]|uniref:Uncharacterized protein n=1 Tax=Sphingobium fuliginis (strain ATCC 27551) TaxID=336203 RepID=A0A292ZMS1_SPHSA|nr:hypothetical protein SFOMI_5008 [Sphingobium fuliginis]